MLNNSGLSLKPKVILNLISVAVLPQNVSLYGHGLASRLSFVITALHHMEARFISC